MLYWLVSAALIAAYGLFFRKWMGGDAEQKLTIDYVILIGVSVLVGLLFI